MPHAALTATAPADPAALLLPPPTKPRGNPNLGLAPRRGARTRAGCPCRAPAIHGKFGCRMHGGRSLGPAHARDSGPAEAPGRIREREARTTHGNSGANARADYRFRVTLLRVSRADIALDRYQDHLPPAFAARLCGYPPE